MDVDNLYGALWIYRPVYSQNIRLVGLSGLEVDNVTLRFRWSPLSNEGLPGYLMKRCDRQNDEGRAIGRMWST